MKGKRLSLIVGISFILALAASLLSAVKGVVVEDVKKYSSGEQAGIQSGDILRSWQRRSNPPADSMAAKGSLTSIFDFIMAETEQGPRGPVKLAGERAGTKAVFDLPVGEWKITVRPDLGKEGLRRYLDGKALIEKKDAEKGIALWEEWAGSGEALKDDLLSCWLYLQIGNALADQRKWKEAQAAYDKALSRAEKNKIPGLERPSGMLSLEPL